MFYDWGFWGSVIAAGVVVMFIYFIRKPQRMFNKKMEHVHVRTIKKF